MRGLCIYTSAGLLELIGPVLPRLGGFHWIIDGGGYDAFQWPDECMLEGDLRPDIARRVQRPGGEAYAVDTEFLTSFGHLLTNFWIDVYGFASPVDTAAWWAHTNRASRNDIVAQTADLLIKNCDGVRWDVFIREPSLLDELSRACPGATAIDVG